MLWSPILFSGSNFPVSALTASKFNEIVTNNFILNFPVFINNENIFSRTSSISFLNASTNPIFDVDTGAGITQSVNILGPITASNIRNDISYFGDGESKSEVIWQNSSSQGLIKDETFYVENIRSYVSSMTTTTNANIGSGSSLDGDTGTFTAPFTVPNNATRPFPAQGLEGCSFSFQNSFLKPSAGNPGYASYQNGQFIKILRTTPKGNVDFFITASFSIPYSVTTLQTQELSAYLYVRRPPFDDDGVMDFDSVFGPVTLTADGDTPLTGSFTGSFIIPGDGISLLNGDFLDLRIEASNLTFTVGFSENEPGTLQSTAFFGLENEYNANLKPSIYLGTTSVSGSIFQGNPWQNNPTSLANVTLNPNVNKSLIRSKGIFFRSGSSLKNFYSGENPITASIRLFPANAAGSMGTNNNTSGLTFVVDGASSTSEFAESFIADGNFPPLEELGSSARLAITKSLAGDGLTFPTLNGNILRTDVLSLHISGNATYSGLQLDSNGLTLNDVSAGSGLSFSASKTSLEINVNKNTGGIITSSGGGSISLSPDLDGIGLNFSSGKSVLNIDSTEFITRSFDSSNDITLKTDSTNQQLAVGNSTAAVTQTTANINYNNSSSLSTGGEGFMGFIGDSPIIAGDGPTISQKTLITGSLFQSGTLAASGPNLILTGSSFHVRSQTFGINRGFVTFNSGSSTIYPFTSGSGGILVNTTPDSTSGSGFFFKKNTSGQTPNFSGDIIASGSWYISSQSSIGYESRTVLDTSPTFSYNNSSYKTISTVKSGSLNPIDGNQTYPSLYGARFLTQSIAPVNFSNAFKLTGIDPISFGPGNALTTADNSSVTLEAPYITTGSGGDIPDDAIIKGYKVSFQVSVTDTSKPVIALLQTRMKDSSNPNFQTIYSKSIDVTSGGSSGDISSNFNFGGEGSIWNLTTDPKELHKVQFRIRIDDVNNNTFRIKGFSGSIADNLYSTPRIQVSYNTKDQESSFFKDENSFDKYGSMYSYNGTPFIYIPS